MELSDLRKDLPGRNRASNRDGTRMSHVQDTLVRVEVQLCASLPLMLCILCSTEDTDLNGESEHPKSAAEARIAPPDLIKDLVTFEVAFDERTVCLHMEEIEDGFERPEEGSFFVSSRS